MTPSSSPESFAGVSDAAVRARTGRGWQEWLSRLDAAGAAAMGHAAIARYLQEREGVPDWWCQMLAVGYEQARGLRGKHQVPGGYQVSVSRTLDTSLEVVYQAWADPAVRRRWLPAEELTIRKATPHKSLRITWNDGQTSVDVDLYDQGTSRSRVVVQHSKLADAQEAERMKSFWREALERLKATLPAP